MLSAETKRKPMKDVGGISKRKNILSVKLLKFKQEIDKFTLVEVC